LEYNRNNKRLNETPLDNSSKQRSFVEEKFETKNKLADDFDSNHGILNNTPIKPQNNNINDLNNLNFFLNFNNMDATSNENNKNFLCPNLHGNLLWSGEKKECQECENFNYGFYCSIDFYFVCFKCYDYSILKTCPHNHELKWVSNKKCFNCSEFNFCLHCDVDNYSVCYKCYNYDFSQTVCPNKHEFKYFNFKSCFLCKKKNKCLGCEKDEFYLCLCNMNKNASENENNFDSCSVFKTVPQFQFQTNKCILGHDLIWKKMDSSCFKCETTSHIGLFCEVCAYYSHCIECDDFKFSILDCPNSHGNQSYKWISEKKECLRCKKTHTGYFCTKCEYFICRKNCVNSLIRKFTGKDRPAINTQNLQKELMLDRLNSENAIFIDDDKNSFIDCSLRDIRIDDLNQSMNSLNLISARRHDNYTKDSNRQLKENQSFIKEHEINNVFMESQNPRLNQGSNFASKPQITNFMIEDNKNINNIFTSGANYLNLLKGESMLNSVNKIYETNKNSYLSSGQFAAGLNQASTTLSFTKNNTADNQPPRLEYNNYQSYNPNINNANNFSYRPNPQFNNLEINKIYNNSNTDGKKYLTNSEHGTNDIVSSGNPRVQTNFYSLNNNILYSPNSKYLYKDFIQKVRVLDEKYVAISTQDFNVAIWNYLNGIFYKNIKIEAEYYKEIIFDSMIIVNEFYLLILYSNGHLSLHDIKNDGKAEIFKLEIGPSYSLLRISENYFVLGLDSKMVCWCFRSATIDMIIQYSKMAGKIFYLEKLNMKSNNLRILSCDEKSIKLWNQNDFSFIKEIEYPQSNLFYNLSFEQKNMLSFDKILTILKVTDDKAIIFNQTLSTISLLDLETSEYINDSKTFEKRQVDHGSASKRIFSTDMFGNLVSFVDGIAILWELDFNQSSSKPVKNNNLNSSYYSNYESLYGKVFLKKIEEINLNSKEIYDLKLLHSISFVTIDNESKVNFWDFHK